MAIFQLTPPARAEMVPPVSGEPGSQCRSSLIPSKTAKAGFWGEITVAIARKLEHWLNAPTRGGEAMRAQTMTIETIGAARWPAPGRT
jgi:hypothetical protein